MSLSSKLWCSTVRPSSMCASRWTTQHPNQVFKIPTNTHVAKSVGMRSGAPSLVFRAGCANNNSGCISGSSLAIAVTDDNNRLRRRNSSDRGVFGGHSVAVGVFAREGQPRVRGRKGGRRTEVSAMGCSAEECVRTVCAFGTQADFTRVLHEVVNKTNDCTQPPLSCTPLLSRYATAGVHGTCGQNEQTRRMIERVCGVAAQLPQHAVKLGPRHPDCATGSRNRVPDDTGAQTIGKPLALKLNY